MIPDSMSPPEVKLDEEGSTNSSGHRVLIFAQLKSYLDIVETDVLAPSGISYLRLDGRWAAAVWPFDRMQGTTADALNTSFFLGSVHSWAAADATLSV